MQFLECLAHSWVNSCGLADDYWEVVCPARLRKVRDDLPVAVPLLKALFDYVDLQLGSSECDDTLRHVRDFIRNHNLKEDAVVGWLENNGGYCDCEALANAEQVVEEAVPDYNERR